MDSICFATKTLINNDQTKTFHTNLIKSRQKYREGQKIAKTRRKLSIEIVWVEVVRIAADPSREGGGRAAPSAGRDYASQVLCALLKQSFDSYNTSTFCLKNLGERFVILMSSIVCVMARHASSFNQPNWFCKLVRMCGMCATDRRQHEFTVSIEAVRVANMAHITIQRDSIHSSFLYLFVVYAQIQK